MYLKYVEDIFAILYKTTFNGKKAENDTVGYEDGMRQLVETFLKVKQSGGKAFFIGNGGSAAIASHMTADFMKNGGVKTYSLYDSAAITCMGNDYGYEYVFSKALDFLLDEKDILVAISSSGNSRNIINAIEVAEQKRAKIITLSGFKKDNNIHSRGDINVYVPISQYGMVESIHNLILQQVVDEIMLINDY